MTMTSKCNNAEVQRNVMSFVDDSVFFSGGVQCEIKMQELVDHHATMNEDTGGKAQKYKVMISAN